MKDAPHSWVLSEQLKHFGCKGTLDVKNYVNSSCDTPNGDNFAKQVCPGAGVEICTMT